MKNIQFCCIAAFMLCCTQASATIIIPPQNLVEMSELADLVVYGKVIGTHPNEAHFNQFQIIQTIKGDTSEGNIITLEEYGRSFSDVIQDVLGDVDFEIEKHYLLFLSETENGYYRSSLLAMSVFEEVIIDGQSIFAHPHTFQELCVIDKELVDFGSIQAAYESTALLEELKVCIQQHKIWSSASAGILNAYTDLLYDDIEHKHGDETHTKADCPNTPPSHCTTMVGFPSGTGSNAPAKFENNNWTIQVPSVAQNDPSNSSNIVDLQNAITSLNTLPGINVTYAGIDASATSINCFNPQATIQSWAGVNDNNGYIIFDDPCSNIPDLQVGCGGGVLGLGGGFTSTTATHTDACGKTWRNRVYPYLLLNNGLGCKGAYIYTSVIVHEFIHGFGLNHISGACTALMNANLCSANNSSNAPNYGITALDEQCVDWMYNAGMSTPTNISVSPKVFLEGAWNGTDMNSSLGQANLIPNQEPYGIDNKSTFISKVNMVDWVVIQIRAAGNSAMVLAEQTGLLRYDGTVVDNDGTSPLSFELAPGNYYVSIKHRNHLSVMTASAVPLN